MKSYQSTHPVAQSKLGNKEWKKRQIISGLKKTLELHFFRQVGHISTKTEGERKNGGQKLKIHSNHCVMRGSICFGAAAVVWDLGECIE